MIGLRSFVGTLRRNASIFAMSSGSLPAALAIVRISGPESKDVLRRLTKKSEFETNRLFYSPIYDVEKQELIDRCMLVFLKGPRTFTGEDTAEIFCHGSKAVVAKLLETLSQIDGLSPAKAGEFTRRAFFNKKMDVAEVESLNDLLQAETPLQLRLAHRQNEASKRLKPFRDSLINITAQVEASIDFAEDIEDQQHLEWKRQTIAKSRKLKDELSDLLKSTCRAILIRRGVKVALVGRTNVGKSSLINRLAERDVAIVSNLPGTTRDSLETRIFLNGNLPLTIFDTAGLRTTTDELENEGIVRTIKRVNEAHIVVFVISAEDIVFNGNFSIDQEINYLKSSLTDVPIANVVLCLNKSDLLSQQHKSSLLADTKLPIILINTLSNEAVSPLISTLAERMSDLANENNDLFLSRERHVHLLETIIDQLEEFENAIDVDIAIAAQHLKNCTLAIGEITGQVTNDTIMNKVFSEFCIGK
ncbi:TRNA modification GTPase GTPBP3, mitochondrial [Aphelenchoides besseyi]|nr:TRNA modification GTPase GTPBP3, mitochondrial [Aphelenchoides besseyi]